MGILQGAFWVLCWLAAQVGMPLLVNFMCLLFAC